MGGGEENFAFNSVESPSPPMCIFATYFFVSCRYTVFTRWGRVGEPGQKGFKNFFTLEEAEKEFKKKFSEKTRNKWENRDNFVAVPGKYTLLEMDDGDGADEEVCTFLCSLSLPH